MSPQQGERIGRSVYDPRWPGDDHPYRGALGRTHVPRKCAVVTAAQDPSVPGFMTTESEIPIWVTLQLQRIKALDELIGQRAPVLHYLFHRYVYDKGLRLGPRLATLENTPTKRAIARVLLKLPEYIATVVLYLLTDNPQERITRQYRL